ncbi:MAG TPA: YdcF family protein [Candidatus Limnocylindrales bacterium]|nr:YdcF family protein [Candidatus Limnocylindrales bacterium]
MTARLGRLVLVAFALAMVAGAWTTWRIWDTGNRDERPAADAIVVLGAAQYDGRPSMILRSRLDHAIALFEAGVAPYFVVTGGKAEGDRTTEAASARTYALSRGVPADAILVEDQGRTTRESLRGVAVVLRQHELSEAVFVSDRTHMLRVLRIAADEGIVAYGSPTTTSPTDATLGNRLEATAREIAALGALFVGVGVP